MNLIINYGTIIAILIRIVTAFTVMFFVLPLLIKEAQVRNGLRRLRIQMLSIGFIVLFISIVSVFLASDALGKTTNFIHPILQTINALALLAISIFLYNIYHAQYTSEAKKVHIEVDKQEKKAERKQKAIDDRK